MEKCCHDLYEISKTRWLKEEEVIDDNVNTGTNTDTNTVSAYNDENFVNDDKKSTEIHNKTDNKRNKSLWFFV